MKKLRKLLFILTVLVMCLSVSTPVSAAVKISSKSVTLTVGQKKQLKVTGTKKKIKWSSNKKKIATVNQKGVVTAKSAGTAKITAKVGSKKYTCTVKVKKAAKISLNKTSLTLNVGQSYTLKLNNAVGTTQWNSSNTGISKVSSTGTVTAINSGTCTITATFENKKYVCTVVVKDLQTANSVQYKSYRVRNGVVVIAKNNYSYPVKVDMDCLFYNASGVLAKKDSDSEYALESKRECLLFALNTDSTWSTHKIEMKVERASDQIVFNANQIKYTSNYGNDNVMVRVTNAGQRVNYTYISILFYKNGAVVGYDRHYAEVDNPGETDTLEFRFPYDSNYDKIIPDGYKIYVNDSYRYVWS